MKNHWGIKKMHEYSFEVFFFVVKKVAYFNGNLISVLPMQSPVSLNMAFSSSRHSQSCNCTTLITRPTYNRAHCHFLGYF